jgi:hypothetical protein
VRFGQLRAQAQGLAQLLERLLGFALLPQHRRKQVVRLRVVRLGGESLPKGRGGVVGAAGLPQHDPQRVPRLRQGSGRIEGHGAPERFLGPGEVVLLLQGHAQVVERFRALRIGRGQLPVDAHRALQVALLQEGAAQVEA